MPWTTLRAIALVIFAAVAGSVVFNAAAYAGAARVRRHAANDCPFDDDDEPASWPARALAWTRAFVVECAVTALLALTLPLAFRRRLRVSTVDAGDPRRPVVLLHGYAQHTANFLWLVRRLRRDGWLHLYTVAHFPLRGDIERSGLRLAALVERIRRESGATHVDVVAHSMGGLVARAALRALGERRGIGRVITLGTPHQGTEAFPRAGRDPMVITMRPGSALFERLGAPPPGIECTSIYTLDDAIVVPATNAYWPGAFNIAVRGLGHLSLLFSPRVYQLVLENLAPEGAATAARDAAEAG